jgi:SAM-dependent methyltransferase
MIAGDSHSSDFRRRHWEVTYGAKPTTELSWFQDTPTMSLAMIETTGLGQKARIVDVGGGASRLAERLLESGYGRLAVLDITSAALAEARARLGPRANEVEFIHADVTAWKPAHVYEIWHDRATFHFLIAAAERRAYRAALEVALAPAGQAIIATFGPDGPPSCSGLPVMRYGPVEIARELGAAFTLVEERVENHRTPAGAIQKFRYYRLRRR